MPRFFTGTDEAGTYGNDSRVVATPAGAGRPSSFVRFRIRAWRRTMPGMTLFMHPFGAVLPVWPDGRAARVERDGSTVTKVQAPPKRGCYAR